ncbi:MAG: hypothetical protein V4465_00205 [Patescibacteria group bacterium]
MGIFFDDTKPHVSKEEFKKVRNSLAMHDFTSKELDLVESFFSGDMNEERSIDKGIDKDEIERGVEALRNNPEVYHLSEKKLTILEEKLKEHL